MGDFRHQVIAIFKEQGGINREQVESNRAGADAFRAIQKVIDIICEQNKALEGRVKVLENLSLSKLCDDEPEVP